LIETQHQHQKDWQILIFSGTILTDDKTIESIKMSDKDFLVLMIKKVSFFCRSSAPSPSLDHFSFLAS